MEILQQPRLSLRQSVALDKVAPELHCQRQDHITHWAHCEVELVPYMEPSHLGSSVLVYDDTSKTEM